MASKSKHLVSFVTNLSVSNRRRQMRQILGPEAKPDGLGWSYTDLPDFNPSTVDESEVRKRVREEVTSALPGIDEATQHVADRPIDTWADQWVNQVEKEHWAFRNAIKQRVIRAEAACEQLAQLQELDERRVRELDVARSCAFDELADPLPKQSTDTGRAKPPSDAGFRAPTAVAGRSAGRFVHVLALVLAAFADIGAFWQVVQLVMWNQESWVAFLVVLGMTACVLYLAHSVGVQLREKAAGSGPTRWLWIGLGTFGWVALGAVAFWLRMSIGDSQSEVPAFPLPTDVVEPPAEDGSPTLLVAILFVALYLGSGLVAAIGAYVTHNTWPGEYRKAVREHTVATKAAAETRRAMTAARNRLRHLQEVLDDAEQLLRHERDRRRHFAEELKAYARTLMIAHVNDPAFTGAVVAVNGGNGKTGEEER